MFARCVAMCMTKPPKADLKILVTTTFVQNVVVSKMNMLKCNTIFYKRRSKWQKV
jgi:hypothetical protein